MEQDIFELIENVKRKNFLVVVEGIKDKRALLSLGITSVITLSRKPLFAIVEEISAATRDVVLLVDLDFEGKKLYNELSSQLIRHGVRIHNEIREKLFTTPLRHIEGLATYLSNLPRS